MAAVSGHNQAQHYDDDGDDENDYDKHGDDNDDDERYDVQRRDLYARMDE